MSTIAFVYLLACFLSSILSSFMSSITSLYNTYKVNRLCKQTWTFFSLKTFSVTKHFFFWIYSLLFLSSFVVFLVLYQYMIHVHVSMHIILCFYFLYCVWTLSFPFVSYIISKFGPVFFCNMYILLFFIFIIIFILYVWVICAKLSVHPT